MKRNAFLRIVLAVAVALAGVAGSVSQNAAAAGSLSVVVNPGVVNVSNAYTINATFENAYVGTGTVITVEFDGTDTTSLMMGVPATIPVSAVSVTAGGSSHAPSNVQVVGHQVLVWVGGSVSNQHAVSITFSSSAGLVPKTLDAHQIRVIHNYPETLTASYTIAQSSSASTTAPSVLAVVPASTQLGATTSYRIDFSIQNALFIGDSVTVQFPTGMSVPTSVDGTNFALVQSYQRVSSFAGKVAVAGNAITLTIPTPAGGDSYSAFGPALPLQLFCGPYSGISNPSQPGNYTFEVWTSKQTGHGSKVVTFGTGVSGVNLTVQPATAGAVADYNIGFTTSAGGSLAALSGNIQVAFPAGFVLPSSIPSGSISVNGKTASSSVSGQNVRIVVPASIGASQAVKVLISRDAGIRNGSASSAGIQLSIFTSSDPLPVQTNAVAIAASVVSSVSDAVMPAVKGTAASHAVTFTTGLGGALAAGDTISLVLPAGFVVPAAIDKTQVSIKTPATAASGIQPASVQCTPSSQSIVLTLPSGSSIAAGASVAVSLPAVITNPAAGGSFTIKVSTSKETTAVDSAPFTVYSNPVSTLRISPAIADGKAGYYTSQPSFVLAVDGPTGTTLSAFYRIDEAGAFLLYDLKASPTVKVPEGKHAVYFYSQDSLGNVEPTRTQQFLVDLTDPIITVASPVQGSVVVQSSTNVTGKIKALDPAGVVLSVGGISTPVAADGSFSAVVSFQHEGVNPIDIIATSPSGRTTSLTLSVNYIARVTMSLVIGSPTVNLNNEFKTLEAAPFISRKGVTMVPLRFISEAFKADVAWDPVFKAVTISMNGRTMRIQVGYMTADVNGKPFALQDAPIIVKGRTFVPLRFIAENFGAQVDWNGQLKMVSIIYPKP